MSPLVIGIAVVLFFGVVLVVLGLTRSAQTDSIGDRLSQFTERSMSLAELEMQQPFSQRVLVPLTR
jgi:tight adherence protein C